MNHDKKNPEGELVSQSMFKKPTEGGGKCENPAVARIKEQHMKGKQLVSSMEQEIKQEKAFNDLIRASNGAEPAVQTLAQDVLEPSVGASPTL